MLFKISSQTIDADRLKQNLAKPEAGALCVFEGWVRNHHEGKVVLKLDYQGYNALANKEGARIMDEARENFSIYDAICIHRVGSLAIGDIAVWIGITAIHRKAAFQACQYVIDEVKKRVPIWKKEHYVDGHAEWVSCHH